jgi:putative hydrolase of the HAD superfamily
MEEIRLAAFSRTLDRIGLPEPGLADHLAQHYFEHRFGEVLLYDDVRPTLTLLARDHRLGLLSNGNSYPERSGLAGVFDFVVFAHDHGVSKPDRRLYDVAARQAQVPPSRLAMIGDSLAHDVEGAQAAGWYGLWLDRDGTTPSQGVRPDATLRSLRDVPAALTALDGQQR